MSLFLLWRLWRSRGAHSGSDRRRPQLLRREQPRLAFQPLENRRLLSAAPLGAEFQVNTFTAGNQGWARVASDGDGDFVVVWESQDQDGDSSGIFAQRFNASGVPQGNEFRVNSVTADAQTLPGVAMNDDGDFVIAWSSAVNSTWRTSARRYDSAGVPQGDEFQIPGSYFDPSVAMDADGDCVIAWQSYEGGSWGVSAQRYDQTGASVGERIRANTSPAYINAGPSVAMTADGDFVIAWTSLDDGSGLGIAARRYDAAGVPQADQFRASTSTSGDQENAAVAMHDDGGFIVTWTSVFEFPGAIYAQAYDAAGMPLGDELAVTPVSPTAKGDPRVAINADGEFVVAWYGSEANSLGVYARFYDPDRLPRGAIVRVNTLEAGHQYRPDVAMLGGEDFVVIWQSQDQDSSGDAIIAQRMRAHLIVRNTQDSGPSSLRQAIELANTQAGPDVIAFNIPTTDPGFIDIDSGVTGGDAAPDVVVIS
ncbi:MAG: hypothetical protein HY000_03765, partial [Planctomycetes bacterium]|nr:hypothetical protein [Planctomycetota bacterium]